ncbi:MAG: inositol monophosphatase family protein [Candidatus Woesebacteria bacterium]|nr:inositol monophosphatase family protein [Candidatus Woesebacteria bacterium]
MDDNIKIISDEILNLAPEINSTIKKLFNTKKNFGKLNFENFKSGAQDITTELDHQIGQMYIKNIFNRHKELLTIDSEENSERIGDGKITLRFDPLDGTKHLFKSIPILSSTMTVLSEKIPVFAMVLDIFAENLYHAYKDNGAFLNSRKINTANASIKTEFSFTMFESPNSKFFADNPIEYALYEKKLNLITKMAYRMRNIGLSSLSICYVADGAAVAFVDFSKATKIYDVEAALLIASESGVIIGDIDGKVFNEIKFSNEGVKKLESSLVVANPIAFNEIATIFSKVS